MFSTRGYRSSAGSDYHLRAGEALERALGDRASERAEELAYHFLLGNDPARARDYLIRAGDRARAIYAQEEASASYEKALELLERAIADGGDARGLRERAIAVAERLADVQRHLGHHDDVLATSRRGIDFATGLDPAARAHAWAFEGFVHEGRHEYDAALESSDRAEQALGPTPPSSGSERWWAEWVAIQQLRMGVHYWRNEPDRFAAILERLRPILEHSGRPADQLELYAQMRSLIWRKNRGIMDDRAVEYARRELQLAKGLGDPEQIAWSTFSMGFVHFWHGDLGEARGTSPRRSAKGTGWPRPRSAPGR